MKQIILVITILLVFSCGQNNSKTTNLKDENKKSLEQSNKNEQSMGHIENNDKDKQISIALSFINSYTENCNKMNESIDLVEWISSCNLTTTGFKKELKRIVDEANKLDPEMGLGADPIFDAQDYPDKGFELYSFDKETHYVVVKGKNWPDFKLTIKLALEINHWLVDGSGIVNIPVDKQSLR